MTVDVVSVICGPSRPELPNCKVTLFDNSDNAKSPCERYQEILEASTADVIVYAHSDLTIHEGVWLNRIKTQFRIDPESIVAAGLGGATSLGRPGLYKQPYRIENMARGGYCSNQTDAETHGERFTGVKQVAVPEAFFMAVSREWLLEIGGWPVEHITHHGIDLWLGCEAARHGKEIWMVGVSCTHHGGGSSTSDIYKRAKWLQGGSMEEDHRQPHKWLYNEYRDVLPIDVKDGTKEIYTRGYSSHSSSVGGVDIAHVSKIAEWPKDEAKDKKEVHEEKQNEWKGVTKTFKIPVEVLPEKTSGKVNIVMVTNGKRPRLLNQSLETLLANTAADLFSLVVVFEEPGTILGVEICTYLSTRIKNVSILSVEPALHILSRLKNLGAYWSEKQFGRGDWLMICDDDIAFLPGWLERMTFMVGPSLGLLGGVRHPYHGVNERIGNVEVTDAVAGYCHFMRWEMWDRFGPYEGNAEGIGQSEDFAFSRKFVDAGYKVGYITPPAIAHCGITNSQGQPAIGSDQFERIPGVLYE